MRVRRRTALLRVLQVATVLDLELLPLFPWALERQRCDGFPSARASKLSLGLAAGRSAVQVAVAAEVVGEGDVLTILTMAATILELAMAAYRRLGAAPPAAETGDAPAAQGVVLLPFVPWPEWPRARRDEPRKSSEFELHHNPLSGIAKGDATKSSAWTKAYTDEGIEYFHNTATGETSWEPPS